LKRAAWFLAGVARHQAPALLSRARIRPGDLPTTETEITY